MCSGALPPQLLQLNQCNRNTPSMACSSAGLINLECATVTANSGPSSFVSQNARKSFPLAKNIPLNPSGKITPGGKQMANTWQGEFPRENLNIDGYERTSPVKEFPPNGYGVHDMIGNVWEWTTDWYGRAHTADAPKACCFRKIRAVARTGQLRSRPSRRSKFRAR